MSRAGPGLALAVLVLGAAAPARAEEPAGFQAFVWGTDRSLVEQACGVEPALTPARPVPCKAHPVEVGGRSWVPVLGFLAATRGLGGYRIEVDHAVYGALRDLATQTLGPAESTEVRPYTTGTGESLQGQRLTWRWPSGTMAWLDERCERVSRSCLTVATRDLAAQMQPRPEGPAESPRTPKAGKGERPPRQRHRP